MFAHWSLSLENPDKIYTLSVMLFSKNDMKVSISNWLKGMQPYETKTPTQVFSCEYCEIFKNSFSYRTPRVVAFICNTAAASIWTFKYVTHQSSIILSQSEYIFSICFVIDACFKSKYWFLLDRSSHQSCSIIRNVLRNFTKFTGKHLCQSLFFDKVAGLRPGTGVFLWILRNF